MMLATALLFLISAAGSGLAETYTALVIYRMIGGAAIGMASTLAPIYISEVAYPEYRGRLGMLQQLAIVLGILSFFYFKLFDRKCFFFLSYMKTNYWRYMLGSEVVPAADFFPAPVDGA
jgi:MFS family permease